MTVLISVDRVIVFEFRVNCVFLWQPFLFFLLLKNYIKILIISNVFFFSFLLFFYLILKFILNQISLVDIMVEIRNEKKKKSSQITFVKVFFFSLLSSLKFLKVSFMYVSSSTAHIWIRWNVLPHGKVRGNEHFYGEILLDSMEFAQS